MNRLIIFITLIISIICCSTTIIAQDKIEMRKELSGVYTIPCEVNGLKLRFILDTGASVVSLSLTEASFMLKNGYLKDYDITGTANIQTADGNIAENYTINLRELKIGSMVLNNVEAVVSSGIDAPLLLGQSVLDKLGHWSIKEGNLILNDYNAQTDLDINNLEKYCEQLNSNGKINELLNLLQSYPVGACRDITYITPKVLYIRYYSSGFGSEEYLSECISEIKSFDYDCYANKYYKYDCFRVIAEHEMPYLNGDELHLYIARNPNYPFDIREHAYETLFLHNWSEYPDRANSYAKEAIDQEMYELARWYCGYYLLDNKLYSEAFKLYKQGHKNGNVSCSFALGRGYIQGYWPEKNLNFGISLLDSLAQTHYTDALYDLCDYYLTKGLYDKVLSYAGMFENKNVKNVYEGISYYNKKDYTMALNRFNLIEPSRLSRNDLKAEFFGRFGEICEKGLGCRPDFEIAYDCYQQLIEYDPAWGYGMLGDMFFLNELIETDAEKAYKYYVLGANNDSGYCCFRLALMNYYGAGTYKNAIKAKEYKEKSIKLGFKPTDFDF